MSDFDQSERQGFIPPPDKKSMYPDATPDTQKMFENYCYLKNLANNEPKRLLAIKENGGVIREYYNLVGNSNDFDHESQLSIYLDGDFEMTLFSEGLTEGIWCSNDKVIVFSQDGLRSINCEYGIDRKITSVTFSLIDPENLSDERFRFVLTDSDIDSLEEGEDSEISTENGMVYKIKKIGGKVEVNRYYGDIHLDEIKAPLIGKDKDTVKEDLIDIRTFLSPASIDLPNNLDDSWRSADPLGLFNLDWQKYHRELDKRINLGEQDSETPLR